MELVQQEKLNKFLVIWSGKTTTGASIIYTDKIFIKEINGAIKRQTQKMSAADKVCSFIVKKSCLNTRVRNLSTTDGL